MDATDVTTKLPVTTITLEFSAEHTDWVGDGQDEQIMIDQVLTALATANFGSVRIVDVDTYPCAPS